MGALVVMLAVLAPWFHELAHWAVARTQTDELEFQYFLQVIPYGIRFGDVEELSNRGLTVTALAPQLFLLTFALLYSQIFAIPMATEWIYRGSIFHLLKWGIFFAALTGGLVISPADLLAVFCQEDYRNWEERGHDKRSHLGLVVVLIRCIFSRG